MAAIPRMVIAAISGYALGGGCELALACDMRFASTRAKFGQPEVLLGIIPGGGGTQRLARLVGPSRAKDLILSGRQVDATEALAMGLVDRVVEPAELMDTALAYAAELAAGAVAAQALAKHAIDAGLDADLPTGLQIEQEAFVESFRTEDSHDRRGLVPGERAGEGHLHRSLSRHVASRGAAGRRTGADRFVVPMTQPLEGSQVTTCYRHPDRRAGVSCQRCDRPICPSCMVQASVGFHCPECTKEAAKRSPVITSRSLDVQPIVTQVLIALNAAAFVFYLLAHGALTGGGTGDNVTIDYGLLGRRTGDAALADHRRGQRRVVPPVHRGVPARRASSTSA